MTDATTIARRYIELWNERTPSRRRASPWCIIRSRIGRHLPRRREGEAAGAGSLYAATRASQA